MSQRDKFHFWAGAVISGIVCLIILGLTGWSYIGVVYQRTTNCAQATPEQCIQSTVEFNSNGGYCNTEDGLRLTWKGE